MSNLWVEKQSRWSQKYQTVTVVVYKSEGDNQT